MPPKAMPESLPEQPKPAVQQVRAAPITTPGGVQDAVYICHAQNFILEMARNGKDTWYIPTIMMPPG